MSLQIASEVVARYPVALNGAASKKLRISAPGILPNVSINYQVYQNNNLTQNGNLDASNSTISVDFGEDGELRFIAMLKLQFNSKSSDDQGRPKYDFIIGNNDGTGADFQGNMAAEINFKFYGDKQNQPPAKYNGNLIQADTTIFDGSEYLLQISDSVFEDKARNNKAVRIKVDVDPANKIMIEECVMIHLFDGLSNLLGIIDTQENSTCFVDLDHSLQIGAFIKYPNALMSADPAGTFTFAIGDPKTDATVSIVEV